MPTTCQPGEAVQIVRKRHVVVTRKFVLGHGTNLRSLFFSEVNESNYK